MEAVSPIVQANNEAILARVDAMGGGYLWEDDIFTVTLIDTRASDGELSILLGLRGVHQIALNASYLSFSTILAIAKIPFLESLVLANAPLSEQQIQELRHVGPEIVLIVDDA